MTWIQAAVLSAAALAGSLHTLVLNTGQRLAIEEEVRIEEGLVVFRAEGGPLYSIPLSEVDLARTEQANEAPKRESVPAGPKRSSDEARLDLERMLADRSLAGRQIVVSEEEKQRLIEEAARSRGIPVEPPPVTAGEDLVVAGVTDEGRGDRDEWYWREKSRGYHDRVTRAKEELAFLADKEQRLQDEILGLLSLGYNPNQFNLQVLQLAHTRDSIPRAQLNLQRAERDLARFKDDARRQGILPGWLR